MEKLQFKFEGRQVVEDAPEYVLVGVVSSGNLEVMIESQNLNGGMQIEVQTSAQGFRTIWEAVLNNFHNRYPFSDTCVSINDTGATPAVVSLRLDQAAEAYVGGAR